MLTTKVSCGQAAKLVGCQLRRLEAVLAADLWDGEAAANPFSKPIHEFWVPRYGFYGAGSGIAPQ